MEPAILLTGGCGYIGSHVGRMLNQMGYRLIVVDNLSTGHPEALPQSAELCVGDIGDREFMIACLKKHRVQEVLHFAASTLVAESLSQPLRYYENNTATMLSLLHACAGVGVKNFIFSSTAAVYGSAHASPVSETVLAQPESVYGRSKLMAEWILQDVAPTLGLKTVILRYFNVAGAAANIPVPAADKPASHLIKVACQVALGQRPVLNIFGADYPTLDGTGVRDFVHVEDIAAAHTCALQYLRAGGAGGVFNCGYGRGYSVREVVAMVEKVSGKPLNTVLQPRRPGDIGSIYADNKRIRTELDWQPQNNSLESIVRSAMQVEKSQLQNTLRRELKDKRDVESVAERQRIL